ncbi:hypothetical protein AVEN_230021-1 [Araneus ventricosus]|uniref:Uncharacterized protein n=1 Tax=Araneus ventricosus TaxID=182803 RepID=A0A4Y2CSZ3_ARAVE|nr:hypothetical protein AVEN_230021-1 [Araneus ventricosus]
MYDATVSQAFSISLIAQEDCCFSVTSSFSDKLFSTPSCCETQWNSCRSSNLRTWLFHKITDIILLLLQSHDLRQRHNLVDYKLHSYCLKPLKVTFDNVLRSKLLSRKSKVSFSNPFASIFDQLEASNGVEVIFPKLSDNKIAIRCGKRRSLSESFFTIYSARYSLREVLVKRGSTIS